MFAADSFNSCNFMCSVDHIRVTIPHVIVTSRVTIARVIALVAYRLPGSRHRNILTCFRAKPCGHFGFEDLMWLKSVEVHACSSASSGKAWFWSSTDRQYFFIFPAFLGSIQWVLHIFFGKLFLFLQNKNFSKSNKFGFHVTWAWELLSNCWFVEKLAWACENDTVNLGDDGTKFLSVWRMVPTMRVFTHGPERRLLRTSGLFKKSLSIICFAGQISLMFHEAYHVTIKSSRFVTLLQAFRRISRLGSVHRRSQQRHCLPPNVWHIFSFCASRGVVSNQILFPVKVTNSLKANVANLKPPTLSRYNIFRT